jgi:hypothetical protein
MVSNEHFCALNGKKTDREIFNSGGRLNIEYLRNFFHFKWTERSDIRKYSICNLQFSIPAHWGSMRVNVIV